MKMLFLTLFFFSSLAFRADAAEKRPADVARLGSYQEKAVRVDVQEPPKCFKQNKLDNGVMKIFGVKKKNSVYRAE